jgi:hypothetical protein
VTGDEAVRTFCQSCGAELAPWFDSSESLYDVEKDDAAYELWLDTSCAFCSKVPRDTVKSGH